MKHIFSRHFHRHARPEFEDGPPHGHRGRHHGLGMRRHGRPFDNGDLRLLILRLIADAPRHGYELIKAIEDRMGGSYTPSPGVIYPTLSMLEEMGLTAVQGEAGGRRRYTITPEGEAHLAANAAALAAILARMPEATPGRPAGAPAPVVRAMENLKLALRLKLSSGALTPLQIESIARALDEAAVTIENTTGEQP